MYDVTKTLSPKIFPLHPEVEQKVMMGHHTPSNESTCIHKLKEVCEVLLDYREKEAHPKWPSIAGRRGCRRPRW